MSTPPPIPLPTNHQLQSPLFGVLPAELRNEIFALTLMPHEDKEATYPKDSYWFRPGFSAPRKSSCALLRTCKAAYVEGQKVFLRDLEWAFWFDRGPQGRSGNAACKRFFANLPPPAVSALQKVRFFTQMYWLETPSNLRTLFAQPNFRPSQLTITIRYSDWWNWEDDAPLSMQDAWLRRFSGPPGLRELRVEYETRVPKKGEMMRFVERNRGWKLPVRGVGREWEGYLSAEHTKLTEWTWKGTSKLGGQEWGHLAKSEEVEYVVVEDRWVFVEGVVTPGELGREATDWESGEGEEDGWEDEYYDESERDEDVTDEDMGSDYEDGDSAGDAREQEDGA